MLAACYFANAPVKQVAAGVTVPIVSRFLRTPGPMSLQSLPWPAGFLKAAEARRRLRQKQTY